MLVGQVVGLRAIERNDLSQLMAWRNKPEFRRYFREYRELNSDNQNQWFEKLVLGDRNTVMFAITELSTDRLLGAGGLCYIDWVNRSADFSIYIGADELYIDELYADDAAKVMMAYGFDELGLHRLWGEIYEFDVAKQEFFGRIGFKEDGRLRDTHWAEGSWHASIYYSCLMNEYINRRKGD
ncbi:GNAT family N-acetyltransferase [Paenibacillus sp. YIM B09110]|uniref:GNAT family N-acetyltransferase n=1 Tax=Paenibacillus sp. YIM B09110 TaxID=3126102 RepID=UPI00301C9CFD